LDEVNARLVNSLTIIECSLLILLEKGSSIFFSYPHSVPYAAHEADNEGRASVLVASLYSELSISPTLAQQADAGEQIAKADDESTTIDAIELAAAKTSEEQTAREHLLSGEMMLRAINNVLEQSYANFFPKSIR
jgi:hypothetical protein